MNGSVSYFQDSVTTHILGNKQMTSIQFEQLKAQLKLLTPQQLRSLQGEIRSSLDIEKETVLTEEELNLITSLFD
ncbi:hypothetical protein J4N42_17515 [Vibrio sp. SCSIO 43135]|uniref:hypothetical protein n=1 Tax=Vibrio sp. SCSIO 43135 TaxID=2819096 RepID=UPI002076050E|nr:hypothetical protein [Vibrio sp. SCSIO 43135]USD44212.1 hypothetical protein J4N42_17515 [Vibrio sp. SCSIO 43135]